MADVKPDIKGDAGDDATSSSGRKVKLVSMEGEAFEVDLEVAQMSELVKTMTGDEDEDDEDDEEENEVPLVNVKKHVLAKVLDYCKHHVHNPPKDIQKPLKTANLAEIVSAWDAAYVNVQQEMLFDLILAANYMDIKPLLDLTCAKVASMIKGKTPEEIRKTFNIENDFTP
eukprot:CAMPEP_0197640488 /NCGR_PEP_ID=MMETSP1338-20131121/14759_1 /TAXON_ID=43686 ORGANISM="Pelagodinium beii, Strain RCC1491" /NCGR_SAMPLE_ID=MMETSP1338 /ASSEMBLY_ACC=CAM_ASM_000754 /LENGTH=170 /DNA_ID=CAMNT_0043213341 /DNA_START=74 /DNA_END=583 /DNA_ORIENTATION=+